MAFVHNKHQAIKGPKNNKCKTILTGKQLLYVFIMILHFGLSDIYHLKKNIYVLVLFCFHSHVLYNLYCFRLYCSDKESLRRQSSQFVQYHIINVVTRVLAPILPHFAEELYQYYPNLEQHKGNHKIEV